MDHEQWLLLLTLMALPAFGWVMCWVMDRIFGITGHLRHSEELCRTASNSQFFSERRDAG